MLPILLTCFLAYICGFQIRKYIIRRRFLSGADEDEDEKEADTAHNAPRTHHDEVINPSETNGLITTLTEIGMGYMVISTISFILAFFGLFNAAGVRTAALIILLLAIPSYKEIFANLFKKKTITFNYYSAVTIVFFFALMSSLYYILATFHDIPVGIDGAREYVKIVFDLIRMGELPQGHAPYYANLFQGYASLLTWQNLRAMMTIPFFNFIMAFSVFYALGRRYFAAPKRALFLLIISVGAMAMTFFLAILDHKTEFFALFMGLLGVYYLLAWRYTKANKKTTTLNLILAALFIGMAFTAKMTFLILLLAAITFIFQRYFKKLGILAGIFAGLSLISFGYKLIIPGVQITPSGYTNLALTFGAAFLIILGIILFTNSKKFFSGIKKVVIFGMIAAIPLVPWMGVHYLEVEAFHVQGLLFGKFPTVDSSAIKAGVECGEGIGFAQDFGRYISHETDAGSFFKKYATLPWEMTVNSLNPNSNTTDIGFLGLALVVILFLLNYKKRKTAVLKGLVLLNLIMWLFWILLSPGVTWYALIALVSLFLIFSALWADWKTQKAFVILINIFIIFFIGITSNFHIMRVIPKIYLGMATGVISDQKFFNMSFPGYGPILNTLKDEDSMLKNKRYVIKAGGTMEFFMRHGYEIVYEDNYLDFIDCGLTQYNDNARAFLSNIKNKGVDYIFISKHMIGDARGVISKRYLRAYNLIAPHLEIVVNSDKIFYGKIPDSIRMQSANTLIEGEDN